MTLRILVLLTVLLGLMMSGASGCSCPSCNYADPVENCKCCVHRQLGKRGQSSLVVDTSLSGSASDTSSSDLTLQDFELSLSRALRRLSSDIDGDNDN